LSILPLRIKIENPKVNSAFYPYGVYKSGTGLFGWVKTGRVHLCRVAANTAWFHTTGDAP